MATVKVIVNKDGTVEVDVNGVKGSGCQKYTDAILKALGGELIKDEKKPEFYQTSGTSVQSKN